MACLTKAENSLSQNLIEPEHMDFIDTKAFPEKEALTVAWALGIVPPSSFNLLASKPKHYCPGLICSHMIMAGSSLPPQREASSESLTIKEYVTLSAAILESAIFQSKLWAGQNLWLFRIRLLFRLGITWEPSCPESCLHPLSRWED